MTTGQKLRLEAEEKRLQNLKRLRGNVSDDFISPRHRARLTVAFKDFTGQSNSIRAERVARRA